jgi:type I restriction enzyme M protein
MGDFFELAGDGRAGGTVRRPHSERSWTVTRDAIEAGNYDLKAVNPHRVVEEDTRTPEELLDEIERQQAVIAEAIEELRRL